MLAKMRKAQSTLEYALLIAVVVGALLAMQNYLKRSIQGRMQISGDQMGDQYSPGMTTRHETMNISHSKIVENTHGGFHTTPSLVDAATKTAVVESNITGGNQSMSSNRTLNNITNENWTNY